MSSLLLLSACGQKGPLYRPVVPADPLAHTAPKQSVPANMSPVPAQDGQASGSK